MRDAIQADAAQCDIRLQKPCEGCGGIALDISCRLLIGIHSSDGQMHLFIWAQVNVGEAVGMQYGDVRAMGRVKGNVEWRAGGHTAGVNLESVAMVHDEEGGFESQGQRSTRIAVGGHKDTCIQIVVVCVVV